LYSDEEIEVVEKIEAPRTFNIFKTRKERNNLIADLRKELSECKTAEDVDGVYMERKVDFLKIREDSKNADEEIVYDQLLDEFKETKESLKKIEVDDGI
jgi:hypothetical protein